MMVENRGNYIGKCQASKLHYVVTETLYFCWYEMLWHWKHAELIKLKLWRKDIYKMLVLMKIIGFGFENTLVHYWLLWAFHIYRNIMKRCEMKHEMTEDLHRDHKYGHKKAVSGTKHFYWVPLCLEQSISIRSHCFRHTFLWPYMVSWGALQRNFSHKMMLVHLKVPYYHAPHFI